MEQLTVQTNDRTTVVDITDRIHEYLPPVSGPVTIMSEHTTAAITVNEAEPNLLEDIETFLTDCVPDDGWQHDQIDDNADAHLRSLLVGPSITVPAVDGTLQLGTWQSILLVECDGPRRRTVRIITE